MPGRMVRVRIEQDISFTNCIDSHLSNRGVFHSQQLLCAFCQKSFCLQENL